FPTCISDIKRKLDKRNKSGEVYQYVGEIIRDVFLIADNASSYNTRNPAILAYCTPFAETWYRAFLAAAQSKSFDLGKVTWEEMAAMAVEHFPPGQKTRMPLPGEDEMESLKRQLIEMDDKQKLRVVAYLLVMTKTDLEEVDREIVIDFNTLSPNVFHDTVAIVHKIMSGKRKSEAQLVGQQAKREPTH
ncbi:hypothetical protein KIPB_011288, partial [Kipferlia bialata]